MKTIFSFNNEHILFLYSIMHVDLRKFKTENNQNIFQLSTLKYIEE